MAVIAWLLLVGTGCAASRNVRLDTGRGPTRVHTPRRDVRPVALVEDAFMATVAKLARTAPVSAHPTEATRWLLSRPYAHVRGHLGLVSVREPGRGNLRLSDSPEAELAAAYGRWCQRKALTGDCLHLLERGPTLDEDGKRTLAFSIALDSVWEEAEYALRGMTDREAVLSMIVTTGALYLGLWLLPEPVSKGVAATMTAVLIAYLGIDTVWSLIQGWMRLSEAVAEATTFDALRDAGEQYGEVMGQNAARAFVMLATAALGSTAETLAAKVPTLPGSAQASLVAAAEGGFRLGAVAQVESVAVSTTGDILLSLAPGAVATGGPVEVPGPKHHIASDKFSTSTANGGPWTPRYQQLFDKAGMSLNDPENQVHVPGHKGPHPQAYHEEVFERLRLATSTCRTIQQCRVDLTQALRILAKELVTENTWLNKLVTRSGG
ncbi:AHH domain-containing protein [Corallococcus sp. NCSPR001]|uniref:AHH domain-containing protein n=1 Tax=Corallococcus sp. NCSPR001 TaxID=2813576 RepID=UPI001A9086AA|nr:MULTISPECIES: AHH domain-containing protein [unclassified Corallococcus]MBN9688354.1 AHH domain-containing protein [Corallococcus sp. NCSPR001]WAS87844.1 AHH domain-containing protein [Corallococcus sp. NCRR]